ncbi:MAG: hypothetical protein V4559_02785 [Pseudomonadota bacterium]
MSQGRPETKADAEPVDSHAERERFEALADKIRQESHLPSQDDQSWREREAIRLSAYDRGYTPPQGNQSWRESEALRFVPVRENDATDVTVEIDREPPLAVPPPVSTTRGGQGGILLAFLLVAAIALGVAALAYPDILTTGFWRTAGSRNNATAETASAPARVARPPVSAPPAEQSPLPPPAPALDLRGTPDPAAPADAANPPAPEPAPVQIIDAGTPPKPAARTAPRDDGSNGGFYAKVPGPDGTLQSKFFPSEVNPGPAKSGPIKSDKEPAVPPLAGGRAPVDRGTVDKNTGGFYARVPGPDGTLEYKYFPSKPPR